MENQQLTNPGSSMIVPRGTKGLPPLVIDMTEIYRIENRIPEIARSTIMTLADLITDFNVAVIRLGYVIGQVELEKRDAERSLDESEAVALLDKAEDVLKAKNIKSSADTRQAVITLDPDVREAKQKVDILTAMASLLNSKHRAIEMAYYSAKKVCEIQSQHIPDSRHFAGKE